MPLSSGAALDWMQARCANAPTGKPPPAWLFRGQCQDYPTIKPSISRLDPGERDVMYNICREFHRFADGVTGYRIERHVDQLGMLQHYVERSPVIDFTGTPDVALYFALLNAKPGDTCVIYALDTRTINPTTIEIADHDFLALPLRGGGLRHRWLRQDGFGICPVRWHQLDYLATFDLKTAVSLQACKFTMGATDTQLVAHLGNLLSVANDPLAQRMRDVMEGLANHLGVALPSVVCTKLAELAPLSATQQLVVEIDNALMAARQLRMADAIDALQKCRAAATSTSWDMSWSCELDAWKARIGRRIGPPIPPTS
jgi:FRG domain